MASLLSAGRFRTVLPVLAGWLLLLTGGPLRGQPLDSLGRARLDERIDGYLDRIASLPPADKKEECDFMLSACTGDSVRNYVAIRLYRHFVTSPLMGDEAVAIHLTDNWFQPGKVRFSHDVDALNARVFAAFNRASLIGERARALYLENPDGLSEEALGCVQDSLAAPSEDYRALYFYDTGCSRCQVLTRELEAWADTSDLPLDLLAIYVGDDRAAWDGWRNTHLLLPPTGAIRVRHYWDPGLDSDFQRKYGVLQTPRLFLIDPEGVVIGRGLDAEALRTLLETDGDPDYIYGEAESSAFYDRLFSVMPGGLTLPDIRQVTAHLAGATLTGGDTLAYKHLVGDLLYYLAARRGEAVKAGAAYVADSLVLAAPQIWNTADDSLQVVGMAEITSDLLSRPAIGSRLPRLRLPGTLRESGRSRDGRFRLRRLKGRWTFLMMYSTGCGGCEEEKAAFDAFFAGERPTVAGLGPEDAPRVLYIDVDALAEGNPALADRLFETFDLTTMPQILLVDPHGRIRRKYLSPAGESPAG